MYSGSDCIPCSRASVASRTLRPPDTCKDPVYKDDLKHAAGQAQYYGFDSGGALGLHRLVIPPPPAGGGGGGGAVVASDLYVDLDVPLTIPPISSPGSWDSGAVAALGAVVGKPVLIALDVDPTGLLVRVDAVAADAVRIAVANLTGGSVDLGNVTASLRIHKI